ncbi:MAG: GNAT family N-acetyltransferase [Lachnospiraceae bacterium]|nr:GNAT family N-acetyltransferase [Lachnospiraceae bacterium]
MRRDRIEGECLYLRRITEADTEQIIKWRNMPHVVERFLYRQPVTRQDHEKWLKEQVGTGRVEQFIIVLREGEREIGSQYFSNIDREAGSAEFGIFIGEEDVLGQGYGTEVLQLALTYAFGDMGMREVTLRALADNTRAIRSYEACGFTLCPELSETMRIDGRDRQVVHMVTAAYGHGAYAEPDKQ